MTMMVEIDLKTTIFVPEEYSGNVMKWIMDTMDHEDLLALLSGADFNERECDHALWSFMRGSPKITRDPDNSNRVTIRRKARCDDCGAIFSWDEVCVRESCNMIFTDGDEEVDE